MHINKRLFFSAGHHKNSKLFALFSPRTVWSLARPTSSHGVLTLSRHWLRTTVFWQVTPCDLVEMYQRFGEACCRCRPPQMRQQVPLKRKFLPDYTASNLKTCILSKTHRAEGRGVKLGYSTAPRFFIKTLIKANKMHFIQGKIRNCPQPNQSATCFGPLDIIQELQAIKKRCAWRYNTSYINKTRIYKYKQI